MKIESLIGSFPSELEKRAPPSPVASLSEKDHAGQRQGFRIVNRSARGAHISACQREAGDRRRDQALRVRDFEDTGVGGSALSSRDPRRVRRCSALGDVDFTLR